MGHTGAVPSPQGRRVPREVQRRPPGSQHQQGPHRPEPAASLGALPYPTWRRSIQLSHPAVADHSKSLSVKLRSDLQEIMFDEGPCSNKPNARHLFNIPALIRYLLAAQIKFTGKLGTYDQS